MTTSTLHGKLKFWNLTRRSVKKIVVVTNPSPPASARTGQDRTGLVRVDYFTSKKNFIYGWKKIAND